MSPSPEPVENAVTRWFGARFGALDPLLQRLHRHGGTLRGRVEIATGRGLAGVLGRRFARALGVPIDRPSRGFEVRIGHTDTALIWARRFEGGAEMVSRFEPIGTWPDGCWIERTGPLQLRLTVDVIDGGWHWRPLRTSLRGVPLPRFLVPASSASKRVENGRYVFRVVFALAGIGPVLSYGGTLAAAGPDEGTASSQPSP